MRAAILACYREQPFIQDELVAGERWSNFGGLYRLEVQAITPGHEGAYGLEWLYATLSGDATLMSAAPGGAWRGVADAGTATPFVILSFQAGLDRMTQSAVRLFTEPLYLVKAVGPARITEQIIAAASAIDALLGRTPGIGTI